MKLFISIGYRPLQLCSSQQHAKLPHTSAFKAHRPSGDAPLSDFVSMENDSELVLERIMEDGTFDELRKDIVERVKQDVCP